MKKATVSRIFIEYRDGSYDTIEPVQEDPDLFLYGLERNNASGDSTFNGSYTNWAIACLLFITAIKNQHTENRAYDSIIGPLMEGWRKATDKKN